MVDDNVASDNFVTDFPARMSDGRFMTDYSTNCDMNFNFKNNLSSWEYRALLTKNGSTIMDNTAQLNELKYGCESCKVNFTPDARYVQKCDIGGCEIVQQNPSGFGIEQMN